MCTNSPAWLGPEPSDGMKKVLTATRSEEFEKVVKTGLAVELDAMRIGIFTNPSPSPKKILQVYQLSSSP